MNFSWDGVRGEEELLIRRMLYDDPEKVIEDYDGNTLRDTFLKNIHRFDDRNRAFWKLVLRISDEEFEQAIASNFRESCKIWTK